MDEHSRRWEQKKYQKILFDMDGVITSERQYWTTAALTVFELYYEDEELNIAWCEENAAAVSHRIFNNDETIKVLKAVGVNTNWDLAYLTLLAASVKKAEGEPDESIWESVTEFFYDNGINAPELYDFAAESVCELYNFEFDTVKRMGKLWHNVQDVFQQWYMGDEFYECVYGRHPQRGKKGLISGEQPLFPVAEIKQLLKNLRKKGYCLGIGTGRSTLEIREPLEMWGIRELFDEKSVVTYDTVERAQKNCVGLQLAKPHPYVFLKGALGCDYPDQKIVSGEYEASLRKTILVVGDAGADILAAKAAGMDFAAVLTGVAGKDSYDYFKELDADYILDDVLELDKVL